MKETLELGMNRSNTGFSADSRKDIISGFGPKKSNKESILALTALKTQLSPT